MDENVGIMSDNVDENGVELIEFIGILPFLLIMAIIGLQLFLVGHTMVVAASAAREGVRALAVCPQGDVAGAVQRASPGYHPEIREASRGGTTSRVVVALQIPTIRIAHFIEELMPMVPASATMRTERCSR